MKTNGLTGVSVNGLSSDLDESESNDIHEENVNGLSHFSDSEASALDLEDFIDDEAIEASSSEEENEDDSEEEDEEIDPPPRKSKSRRS